MRPRARPNLEVEHLTGTLLGLGPGSAEARGRGRLRRTQTSSDDRGASKGNATMRSTVIRALLVPALMQLLGEANWWMPNWTRIVLRIPRREPAPEIAAESA